MSCYTVQLAYPAYFTAIVAVDADSLDEACRQAVTRADSDDAWKSSDHVGDVHVSAICESAGARPWATDATRLPVPDEFREEGTPPLVTLDPNCPHGTLEVTRGTVRFRFVDTAATVTTELSDPPPPPQNKPVVTVKRRPDGAPDIMVQGGKAIVRLEGWQQDPALGTAA